MSSSGAYGPTPPAPERRRRGGVVGPFVLIFLGCVFLLQNTGYLPPNAWQSLWRFWPVILVLAGIELILANRVPWPVLAAVAALVLVVATLTMRLSLPPTVASTEVTHKVATSLDGATQATVSVRFGAGELALGPLVQPPPDELAVMNYQGPADLEPQAVYVPSAGGVGRLDYRTTDSHAGARFPFFGSHDDEAVHLDVNLAPTVPIQSLQIQTGATDAHLDLSDLNVASTDVALGAASAWIRLPEAAGNTTAHISGGAASITVEIPQGVAAQVRHKGGLSTLDIDEVRFPQVSEGLYRSADYGSATNQVELSIESGLSTIAVR